MTCIRVFLIFVEPILLIDRPTILEPPTYCSKALWPTPLVCIFNQQDLLTR